MTALLPAIAGALCGIATLFVMRRFSDQSAIRTARARMRAHLYELRLFNDDPLLMLRAQKRLLLWNLRYLRLALTPAAIMTAPVLILALQLDALYGKRALLEGETATVTAELNAGARDVVDPVLDATPAFRVDSPSVRIMNLRQVYWRVRASGSSDGVLKFKLRDETVLRRICAGPGFRYVSSACGSSMLSWIRDGCRVQSRSVESILIDYPTRKLALAGFQAHWAVWFGSLWVVAMLVFRGRFDVAL